MAKKKSKADSPIVNLEVLDKELASQFGEGIITSGRMVLENPKHVFKLSPSLDMGLSGGIPEGCVISCCGKAKSGKTTTALHFAGKVQSKENGSRPVFYIDVEHRLKDVNLNCVNGLDVDNFRHIHSEEGKILTAEEFLMITEKIIKSVPGAVIIFDSFSAICTEAEMGSDYSANTRNGGPKLMAQFCRKNAAAISVNRVTLWGIQHLIANTAGGQGPKYHVDGGNKFKHQLDVQMQIAYHKNWEIPAGNVIGHEIHWKITTSALGAPCPDVVSYHRWGHGIDELYETIQIAIDLGFISKSGTWYTYNEEKRQGEEKLYNLFIEQPELADKLREEVKGVLG